MAPDAGLGGGALQRAVVAAWLCMLLLAAGGRSTQLPLLPDCTASAPFGESSFRLAYRSSRAYSAPSKATQEPEAWRRVCFTLYKNFVSPWLPEAISCSPNGPCCTTDVQGPTGLARLAIGIGAACLGSAPEQKAAFGQTWWSFGGQRKPASAKFVPAGGPNNGGAAGAGGTFNITLLACERSCWTEAELCVNLIDNIANPCRKLETLCGESGCPVVATTTTFRDPNNLTPASCCLSGKLQPPVCQPPCQSPLTCVRPNTCAPPVPPPDVIWRFDECRGAAPQGHGAPPFAFAWLGAGAAYERCSGGGGSAGCVLKLSSEECCTDAAPSGRCAGLGKTPWCDDPSDGAVATLRGAPPSNAAGGGQGGPMPETLDFAGLGLLTVSVWVKPAAPAARDQTLAGRSDGDEQFWLGLAPGGVASDVTAVKFSVTFECDPDADPGCTRAWDRSTDFSVQGGQVPAGRWSHVAGALRDGYISAYVDGRLVATQRLPPQYRLAGLKAHGAEAPPIYVGGHPLPAGFDGGRLDCLAFWKGRGLGQDEVRQLHEQQQGSCGCPEG